MLTALAIATEAASKVIETMSPSLHPRMDDEPPQRALLPSHGSCAPSQLALKGSSQLGPSHAPDRAARKDTASEMTLVYLNSLILLIGFELNVSIEVLKKEQNQLDLL
jgi:hypothetical protein